MGILTNEEPSAIFRLEDKSNNNYAVDDYQAHLIGIFIEPIDRVLAQSQSQMEKSGTIAKRSNAGDPLMIAQKLLENFINYYISFSGTRNFMGQESIPIKALQDWYDNLVKKAKSDPLFIKNLLGE